MRRIEKIVSFVEENKVVADIGSDHGITAIKVYEEKNPKKVIATDISKDSLQKLEDKLKYNHYKIETIVTDGLNGLPNDIDQIIISGMGGHLITKILLENIKIAQNVDKLILSPNNSKKYFRKWLHENNFEIIKDENVEDEGIIYDVITAKYSKKIKKYEYDLYYTYGKQNILNKNPLTIKLIENEIKVNESILSTLKNNNSSGAKSRIFELMKQNKEMEDLLCKLKK